MMTIRTRVEDEDTDEEGFGPAVRKVPVGTIGTAVWDENIQLWQIDWENGASTFWTQEEITRDAEIVAL